MAPDFHQKVNLPIIDKQRIAGGGSVEVYKITVHPEYNHLFNEDVSSPHVSWQSLSNVVQEHQVQLQIHSRSNNFMRKLPKCKGWNN